MKISLLTILLLFILCPAQAQLTAVFPASTKVFQKQFEQNKMLFIVNTDAAGLEKLKEINPVYKEYFILNFKSKNTASGFRNEIETTLLNDKEISLRFLNRYFISQNITTVVFDNREMTVDEFFNLHINN